MSAYTIKDLENLSGIKAHTIRMWEQRYNFLKPQRSCTNIRCYNGEELKKLLNIALLNKYGFKISHIDRMKPEEICQKVLCLREFEAMQERVINELVQDMVDLQTDKFEDTLNRYIRMHGIEKTIREIIFPFLEKIGILWQTGHIIPAQEHFVSNLIRQKLIAAIDNIPCNKEGAVCLLFLPEKEYHELGLLFLHYLLKSGGSRVTYLGANVPMADVQSVVQSIHPQYAFMHLTSSYPNSEFERLLKSIQSKIPGIETIITGLPIRHYNKELAPLVKLKRSLQEATEFIDAIPHRQGGQITPA